MTIIGSETVGVIFFGLIAVWAIIANIALAIRLGKFRNSIDDLSFELVD